MVATTTKKAAAPRKVATHPTFLAMIQEAIKAHPEESRAGVSRPTIKKFLAATYKIDISSASNVHNLNNAIKRGSETGALVLPKGNSGRIKLAPKKPAAGKENAPPKKAAAAKPKKAAAPKPAAKKAAAKPAAAKPAAAKKAATTAKKPAAKKAAAASTTKKPAAAKPKAAAAPKKAPAKKAAAPKAK
ncbi:uncharacterized protein EHS24_007196 [Apiotrichum porosum]|uniref:Histone H1 n=1 Tax=Apiotrichum porosum TaxID=105984 RepID=A0A427XXC4_9TREE|nr:uncharacterized protein EHS24_007196 [Apiotrichum porosum]RSH83509.1 hypothetical protein EHS24_007196 [Apiotrichum porosum]